MYLESSALLARWLEQVSAVEIAALLKGAEQYIASGLTQVECDRAFIRAEALASLAPARAEALRQAAAITWEKSHILRFDIGVVERARRPFPVEPIRTLDALHAAFYERARSLFPGAVMLSLDERVRRVARAMGGEVLPD